MIAFLHLIAAATWLGGLITLGALVPALRKAGVTQDQLRAMARAFGRVSWTAMAVAVVTGLIRFWPLRGGLTRGDFFLATLAKVVFVGLTIILAWWHQTGAREENAQMRGMIQGLILLASLGIFAAALNL